MLHWKLMIQCPYLGFNTIDSAWLWNLAEDLNSTHKNKKILYKTYMIRNKNLHWSSFSKETHLQLTCGFKSLHWKKEEEEERKTIIILIIVITLLTIDTTASRISPLKGRKTTHWYLTGKVTNPTPSRIRPLPTLSIPVIATMKPWRPLQLQKRTEKREFLKRKKNLNPIKEKPRRNRLRTKRV